MHVDLYRLDRADLDEIGLDPDIANAGVTAVEWAERLTRGPAGAIVIRIRDEGEDVRLIRVEQLHAEGSAPIVPEPAMEGE